MAFAPKLRSPESPSSGRGRNGTNSSPPFGVAGKSLKKRPSSREEFRRQPLLYSKSRNFKADLIICGDESRVFERVWVAT